MQRGDGEPILSYKPMPIVYFGKAMDGLCTECDATLKRMDSDCYEDWLDSLPSEDPLNPSYIQR